MNQPRRNKFSDIPGVKTHIEPQDRARDEALDVLGKKEMPDFRGLGVTTHLPRRGDAERKQYPHLRGEK